jgi:ADP-ribose pyrophosphatase YjhB (NUDIX family)
MLKAVTAIIEHPTTSRLVLGVSRKDDTNDFGLPGGKLDLNESWEEALVREIQEETGLVPIEFECVMEKVNSYKGLDYQDRTYYVYQVKNYNLSTKEKGIVSWIPWTKLMDPSSSFHEYNKAVYKHMQAMNCLD